MFAEEAAPRVAGPRRVGQGSATALHRELNARALRYAAGRGLLHDRLPGGAGGVLLGAEETSAGGVRHGNFVDGAYREILRDPAWAVRLGKAHTACRRAWPRCDWAWRELDAAASSDALLMNVFCYPGVLEWAGLRALLGVGVGVRAEFGYKPRIPLLNGRFDRTEIDMRLGGLLVEAKLTETGFAECRWDQVERYRDYAETFEGADKTVKVAGYQLVRGVLAAVAEPGASFCVLADRRRPDLMEAWARVMAAVRRSEVRCRLQMLTWQEVAGVVPRGLQDFLDERYGINAY
jgi:hypothetical protein